MEPDLRFFQAAATVIPTLLIAAAFTAKTFQYGAYDKDTKATWWLNAGVNIILGPGLFFSAVWGESVCLRVLQDGAATPDDADSVETALAIEGAALLLAILASQVGPVVFRALAMRSRPRVAAVTAIGMSLWILLFLYLGLTRS